MKKEKGKKGRKKKVAAMDGGQKREKDVTIKKHLSQTYSHLSNHFINLRFVYFIYLFILTLLPMLKLKVNGKIPYSYVYSIVLTRVSIVLYSY